MHTKSIDFPTQLHDEGWAGQGLYVIQDTATYCPVILPVSRCTSIQVEFSDDTCDSRRWTQELPISRTQHWLNIEWLCLQNRVSGQVYHGSSRMIHSDTVTGKTKLIIIQELFTCIASENKYTTTIATKSGDCFTMFCNLYLWEIGIKNFVFIRPT